MKKIAAVILAAVCAISAGGCSVKKEREQGKIYTAKVGEVQENTYFSTVVNSVRFSESEGGYVPNEGNEFVCVDLTVENITETAIPMGCYDFYIRWGEGASERDKAVYEDGLAWDMYDLEFSLDAGRSYTATLYFAVPVGKRDALQLVYEEYFDDDFVGCTYVVELT